MTKNYVSCTPYLRKHTSYDRHLWYTSVKSSKNCLDYLERALFILFLTLGVINSVKSFYKKKIKCPKKEKD